MSEIFDLLKLSYDGLHEMNKNIFLDVALLLKGKDKVDKEEVIERLDICGPCGRIGINALVQNSLLAFDISNNSVAMHDLLKEVAFEIDRQAPGRRRRSRLCNHDDISHVFVNNTATSAKWIFLLISLCLEILSLACDQASSPRNPHYALFGMMLAIAAVLICILELIYKGKKERVELRRWRTLWWFYYPRPQRRLYGSLPDIYGLVGAISQCICSTVQYVCFIRHNQNPIKVSLLPAIFLICLGASRLNYIGTDETNEQNV